MDGLSITTLLYRGMLIAIGFSALFSVLLNLVFKNVQSG
jgi:hypothetical protein